MTKLYETQEQVWADGSVFAQGDNETNVVSDEYIESWEYASRYLWAQSYFMAHEKRTINVVKTAQESAMFAEKNSDKVLLAIFGKGKMPESKIVNMGKTISKEDAAAARAFVFEYTKENKQQQQQSIVAGDKIKAELATNGDLTSNGLIKYMAIRKIASSKELEDFGFSHKAMFTALQKGVSKNRKGEYVYTK